MALVTSQNLPYWRNSFWGTSPSYNFRTLSKLHPRSSSVTCLLLVIILIITKSSENIQNHHYSQPHLLTIVDRLGLHVIRLPTHCFSLPCCFKTTPSLQWMFRMSIHANGVFITTTYENSCHNHSFVLCVVWLSFSNVYLLRRGHKNKKRKSVFWRFLRLLLLHFGCGR